MVLAEFKLNDGSTLLFAVVALAMSTMNCYQEVEEG